MPSSMRLFCLSLSFTLLSAARLQAQAEVTVLPGEPLKLEVVGPSSGPVGARCSGRVTSAAQDTLIVVAGGSCARGSYLANLQVIRGDRGSRLDHIGFGALGGGLIGALAGRIGSKTTYNSNGQVNRGRMWVGLGIGAAAGAAVGYALPAGPRWVPVGSPQPLRVIGVNLQPGLEVAVGR